MRQMVKKMLAMIIMTAVLVTYMAPIRAEAATVVPKLNKTGITLHVGRSYNLKAVNTKKKATWISSNKKVAAVSSKGKVTAKKTGTAYVTVKVGSKSTRCKIVVKKHSWKTVTKPVCGKKNGLRKCACGASENLRFNKHKWVHHFAWGHYEEKVVGTEQVLVDLKEGAMWWRCSCYRKFYSIEAYDEHAFDCPSGGGGVVGYDYEPVYETRDIVEQVWVTDSKPYYKCSNCGKKKYYY